MAARLWPRLRAWSERPGARHAMAIAVLVVLHLAVFARSLFPAQPSLHIPWDFVDSYNRFLIFASDSLRAGSLPLWYPYGEAGMPFFLHPQNQLWTPVTWLVGGLFGYNIVVVQWQVILTMLAGGIGCYVLAASLWEGTCAALFAALAYNFTAARLSNCEHLDIVNAFAILPWLFWALRRVALQRRGALVLLAFLGYLFLVSGYPGVVLVSPFWLGGWVVFLIWEMDGAARKRFARHLVGAGLLALVLGAGYWLPVAAYRNAFGRGAPLGAAQALAQSLTLKDLSHLIFGVGLDTVPDGGNIDVSMRGLYFGILALPAAVAAVIYRRDRLTAAVAGGSLFALLMAAGSSFFVRVALHTWFGFLNLSRFPAADARAVAVLGGALLAGAGIDLLVREPAVAGRFLARTYLALIACLAVGLLVLRSTMFQALPAPDFADRVTAPVIAECLWLVIACILYRRLGAGPRLAWALVVLAALDVGHQAGVNYFTVGQAAPPEFWQITEREHVATFDPAKAMVPRTRLGAMIDVHANLGYTSKSFFLGTYGPFELKSFTNLIAAGFSDWLANGRRVVAFGGPVPDAVTAFTAGAMPVDFSIDTYLPDRVTYTVNVPTARTLVFNEMFFPGWKATVDGGASVNMAATTQGLRSLSVPAGRHRIATRFSPPVFWVGAMLSLAGWLAAIAALMVPALRRRRSRAMAA